MADLGGAKLPETRLPAPETGGVVVPETSVERPAPPESVRDVAEQAAETATREQERAQSASAPVPAAAAPARKDPVLADVERVLEDGLAETYAALPPEAKQRFRAKGEATAGSIRQMLARGRLTLKDVWKLIRDWLRAIPGVSRFFIEQEAKIKTDRIIHLAEKQKHR